MKDASYWQRRKSARQRWSFNACRKRERNRVERANAPLPDERIHHASKPRRSRPDLKVILERRDGMRIQFSLHNFYGKLVGQTVNMSPKQFGRRLGEIFNLWCMA
jgi:hypothetical protein